MENITHLSIYIISISIFFIGTMCGIAQYFESYISDREKIKTMSKGEKLVFFFKYSLTGGLLAFGIYMVLDEFNLKTTTQFGITTIATFMGYDKIYAIIERVINKKIG